MRDTRYGRHFQLHKTKQASNQGNCLILESLQITEKVNSSFRIGTEVQQILEDIEVSISFFLFK